MRERVVNSLGAAVAMEAKRWFGSRGFKASNPKRGVRGDEARQQVRAVGRSVARSVVGLQWRHVVRWPFCEMAPCSKQKVKSRRACAESKAPLPGGESKE